MRIFTRYSGPPLMGLVCSVENLTLAWRRVRSNIQYWRRRRSAGVDAMTLSDFEADWSNQMARLADELANGSYRPLPPRWFRLPKESGGERAIAILTIRDRVAQRAVQQVLTPLFEPLFLDCSYGCRSHVGVPDAIARVVRYADQGLGWVVDTDIAAYFDHIDQGLLMGLLRQRIDEPALLALIGQWLQVGTLAQDESAPLDPETSPGTRLLQRGAQLIRSAFELPARSMAQPALIEPYDVGAWDAVGPSGMGGAQASHPGVDNMLWSALMLAQPTIEGMRRAAPMVRRIGAQRLLVGGALAAGAIAAGELMMRSRPLLRGTMQGGALSPLLANIYLHPFDLAMTSNGLRMVRYMDDLVVMCATEEDAGHVLRLIERQLDILRLRLNPEKTHIVNYAQGLDFLGRSLVPRQSGQRLGEGLTSFAQAEQALRDASSQVQERMRTGVGRVGQRFRRSS